MAAYRAVLFDWMLTLADNPPPDTMVRRAGVKPDPAIYRMALDAVGIDAADALMVGDRHTADGAAALLGIDSLILPARRASDPAVADSRLWGVVRLVG